MNFDLHFGERHINPLTNRGKVFLETLESATASTGFPASTPANYQKAYEAGLGISFQTADIRDRVTTPATAAIL